MFRSLLVILTFGLASLLSAAQFPDISVSVQPTSATVGQHIVLRVSISAPELERLSVEGPAIDKDSTWSLVSAAPPRDENVRASVRRRVMQYTLAAFETGQVLTPKITVRYQEPSGQPVVKQVPQLPVEIVTVLSEKVKEPRDIKGPLRPPAFKLLPWMTVLALAILLPLLAWYLWRRLHPRIRQLIRPPKRLDEWAMDEIDSIEGARLVEQQKIKEFYTRIADTIRIYLGRLYGFDALDLTTGELVDHLGTLPLPEEEKGRSADKDISELMEEADLVKFAKYIPEAVVSRRALDRARMLIRRHWANYEARTRTAENEKSALSRPGTPPGIPVSVGKGSEEER